MRKVTQGCPPAGTPSLLRHSRGIRLQVSRGGSVGLGRFRILPHRHRWHGVRRLYHRSQRFGHCAVDGGLGELRVSADVGVLFQCAPMCHVLCCVLCSPVWCVPRGVCGVSFSLCVCLGDSRVYIERSSPRPHCRFIRGFCNVHCVSPAKSQLVVAVLAEVCMLLFLHRRPHFWVGRILRAFFGSLLSAETSFGDSLSTT